jgi:hypothetical protein
LDLVVHRRITDVGEPGYVAALRVEIALRNGFGRGRRAGAADVMVSAPRKMKPTQVAKAWVRRSGTKN